jgi:NADPH:quinone reductase-like Zn-dependent oxidoreductase
MSTGSLSGRGESGSVSAMRPQLHTGAESAIGQPTIQLASAAGIGTSVAVLAQ